MLGGINTNPVLKGDEVHQIYYIRECNNEIVCATYTTYGDLHKVFTLEEFEEKFPYKVGNKVISPKGIGVITEMKWLSVDNEVRYRLSIKNDIDRWFYAEDLQPYKEQETIEEKTYPPYMDYDVKTIKTIKKEILPYFLTVYDSEENKHEIVATDGYEIKEENGKFYAVKKKPQYPKTYEECCEILELSWNEHFGFIKANDCFTDEENKIIEFFIKLKRCRDAYWKLSGEQMGLGKPWEPDWVDSNDKFIIQTFQNEVGYWCTVSTSRLLAFPTREMRDAFHENFKDLIETCKELL